MRCLQIAGCTPDASPAGCNAGGGRGKAPDGIPVARTARAGAADDDFDVPDEDDSKRIVRVGGAVAPAIEVGHTHRGHGT
jgi:hypothetical protein